jgi:hypothetical protein
MSEWVQPVEVHPVEEDLIARLNTMIRHLVPLLQMLSNQWTLRLNLLLLLLLPLMVVVGSGASSSLLVWWWF